MNFVFHHNGQNTTPIIEGVDRVSLVLRAPVMLERLTAFERLHLTEPALYLDSDMIMTAEPCIASAAGFIPTRRDAGRNEMFNTNFGGMDLSEYAGMTIGQVYPYVACLTYAASWYFWELAVNELLKLDAKFFNWYGDQEALKRLIPDATMYFSEDEVACLPERYNPARKPWFVHFKGESRKSLMLKIGPDGGWMP